MVLPWQLNESYPNAWCTSALDFHGDPKPAYFAVTRAFAERRVTLRVDRAAWHGHTTARVEAWLWAEQPVGAGSVLTLAARGLDGTVYAWERFDVQEVSAPAECAALSVTTTELPDIFVWEAEWVDATDTGGSTIDVERMLATTTADFGTLFDARPATLEVVADDEGIVVRNAGTIAAVTLRIVDPRPAGAPGWLVADGDTRPLFPGEERRFAVRWVEAPASPVLLEGWNVSPALI